MINVSEGNQFSVAVSSRGHVYTWGDNRSYELGHGDEIDEVVLLSTRVQALAIHKILSVSAGSSHWVAVTSVGEVFSWGSNICGQCGHRTVEERLLLPLRVEALTASRARSASAGSSCSLVVTDTGTVYTLGVVDISIGLTRDRDRDTGVPIAEDFSGHRIKSAVAGRNHALALTEDGDVFSWGTITGDQFTTHSAVPMLISRRWFGPFSVCGVEAGYNTNCAVTTKGELFTW